MKKLLAVIALFMAMALFPSLSWAGPDIRALDEPWDFGEVIKGQTREKAFRITNAGDKELVIDSVRACCGYSVVSVASWAVAPGGYSDITVLSDTGRKNAGLDQRAVTIVTNDDDTPQLRVTVVTRIIEGAGEAPRGVPSLTAADAKEMLSRGSGVVFLDVREESEFREKHIPDAVNLPRSAHVSIDTVPDKVMDALGGGKTVVVYCGGGSRSSYIAGKLSGKGFPAFNLEGGLKGWEKEGYELVYGPKVPGEMRPIAISAEEAYEHYYRIFGDKVMWIDVRAPADYEKGHIKGAVNIEGYSVGENIGSLPKEKDIVLYCSGEECDESTGAGTVLIENGFKQGKIRDLRAGFRGWSEAGYPVATGAGDDGEGKER